MKLTTNSRYGLRALADLTANDTGAPVALAAIAARQRISESYLEQAFSALRRAGVIRSAKGAQGGYTLAGDPEAITAGAVLRILEGDLGIVDGGGDADPIRRCIRSALWDEVDECIARTVDSVTLGDLAREYRRMRGNALEYTI